MNNTFNDFREGNHTLYKMLLMIEIQVQV